MLDFLLYLTAFLLFVIAAFAHDRPFAARVNLVAAGLAAWVLVPLHHVWPG